MNLEAEAGDEPGALSKEASGMRCAPSATERDLRARLEHPDAYAPTMSSEHEPSSEHEADERHTFDENVSTTRPRPPERSESKGQAHGHLPDLPPHLQVRKVLGQGGTAVVYEALHTRLNVRVAVKVLALGHPSDTEARERLLREAELYARLSDPRFPRVYDVDELPDGTPFVVMEFIEGRTLAETLLFGPLAVDAVYAIGREILEALTEIHRVGIVHRDIKPSNILLEGDWGDDLRVRLVDFGIAKSVFSDHASTQLTQQGTMLGTPHYMAPEQITAQPLDERVDIYAVGVVLYELLTGQMPFDGPTVGEVIASALRDTPRAVSSLRGDVPEAFEALIAKAMSRERDQRFASAHEMLCALHAARIEAVPPPAASDAERVLTIVPDADDEPASEPEPGEDDEEPLTLVEPRAIVPAPLPPEAEREAEDMLTRLREVGKKDAEWFLVRFMATLCIVTGLLWPARLLDGSQPVVLSPASELQHNQTSALPAQNSAAPASALPEARPALAPLPAAPADSAQSAPSDSARAAPAAAPASTDTERVSGRDARKPRRTERPRRAADEEPAKDEAPRNTVLPQVNFDDARPEPPPTRLEMRRPLDSHSSLPANPY